MSLNKLKVAALSRLNAARQSLSIERVARAQSIALVGGYALLMASDPAMAQSLRQTGESIFTTLYGIVGVAGGISFLVCMLNMKFGNFLGREDPKKTAMQVLAGTAASFAVVAIIQFIKGSVGSSGSISGV